MPKLKKLTRAEKIRILSAAESGQLSADQILDKLVDSGPKEWWVSYGGGPWKCNGKEDVPFDQRHELAKNKSIQLVEVTYGDRNGNQTIEYNGKTAIEIHSTGVPLANRETDVDMGEYMPADNKLPDTVTAEPVRIIKNKSIPPPSEQNRVDNDSYWSFSGTGRGDRSDIIAKHYKDL